MADKFKEMFSVIGWAGFAITLLCILLYSKCNPEQPQQIILKETKQIYDSSKKTLEVRTLPGSVSVFTVPVPSNIDTLQILKSYFSVHTYSQQIQDTSIRAFIFDSISENKIIGRRFSYQYLKPVRTIESSTITINPSGLFIGGFAGGSKNGFGIGPEIHYLHKNKNIFGLSYDIPNRFYKASITFNIHARGNGKIK